jgi:PhoPQ-activated pathogenicity-related protein
MEHPHTTPSLANLAGGWSFALGDYLQQGCMGYLNKPEFIDLAAVVDPYTYRYVSHHDSMNIKWIDRVRDARDGSSREFVC